MLLNIVFSYNRAMQLDCFLKSFLEHIKYPNYQVAVVYHTSGHHDKGYNKLINKYKSSPQVVFYERGNVNFYFLKILPLLKNLRNLYRVLKYKYLRSGVDNFKFLVESIIENSNADLLMFSTDDTIYDGDIVINDEILCKLKRFPDTYSYRLFLGRNLAGEYKALINPGKNNVTWDYYENQGKGPWGGVFCVDGTIYEKSFVYESMKKVVYHMPATLESFLNTHMKKNKYLRAGAAPLESCLSNIWINRVQHIGHHEHSNINVNMLNELYLDGFGIKYFYDQPVRKWGIIPDKVEFEKNN